MSGDAKQQDPSELIWMRKEPGVKRGLSQELIGRAAVEIADAEGFDAVAMRRIASELGAGTMSLYHYVRNKEELVSLMSEAVMTEQLVSEPELPSNWRDAFTVIARQTRVTFKRHPWLFDALREPGQGGPTGLRHFEQSIAALRELRLPPRKKLELVAQLDDYVFGFSLRELLGAGRTGPRGPELTEAALDYLQAQFESGEYPEVRKLLRGDVREAMLRLVQSISGDKANDRRFERGLQTLLDGIERSLGR